MKETKRIHIRERDNYSWGARETCRELFEVIFKAMDKTITEYQHLPEYDQIIDWMCCTEGKGLLLMRACGRGKSVIMTGVLPMLFRYRQLYLRVIHAQDLHKPLTNQQTRSNVRPETNLDFLISAKYPVIDEVGVENQMNDYGEKTEGFNLILNTAERDYKPLFIATNLTAEELLIRYGERTFDRLKRLCKRVEFKGDSLRK